MEPALSKDAIQAELRAAKEMRPWYLTRLRGAVAADDFRPELHGKIEKVFYPKGYRYKTSYRLPAYL